MSLKKILRYSKRTRFSNPNKSCIVIYDEASEECLSSTVLNGMDYTILHARKEQFNFSFKMAFFMFYYMIKIVIKRRNNRNASRDAYNISFLRVSGAKVVVTFIDNRQSFYSMQEFLPGVKFISIQNGMRDLETIKRCFQKECFLGDFYCLGDYEVDLYRGLGFSGNFFPVGSVRAEYFRSTQSLGVPKRSICYVSQFREPVMMGETQSYLKFCLDTIQSHLIRFLKENPEETLSVALAGKGPVELEYFKKVFEGFPVEFVENTPYSSYLEAYQSELVVTFHSTVGFEALGFGKRVLFCNYSGREDISLDVPEMCLTTNPSYDEFREKLKNLLDTEQKQFYENNRKKIEYIYKGNPDNPAHEIIRKKIVKKCGFA